MKIAFLSFYSGVSYRGVETFVHELANRLHNSGHNITVYQFGAKLPGVKYKTISIEVPMSWKQDKPFLMETFYFGLKVKKFTKIVLSRIDKDTDIIFPTNGQWQGILCSIWAKIHRKKIIVSGQSGPGIDDRINLWTFPDRFVTLTDFQREWAKKVNPFVKIEKIPNGVDLFRFGNIVKPLDIGLPKPIILCVGAFDFWKRQDLLIKAVSKLAEGSVLLVGKGKQESELSRLGQELLGRRFRMLNFPHNEMPKVYRAADIFTYPTVPWESFGIVLVEAMGSGLPVVATDDPIRREIVGDAGFFVDPRDTDAYAKALREALDKNWGDIPRKQAEKFDWDEIAIEYEKLFKSL